VCCTKVDHRAPTTYACGYGFRARCFASPRNDDQRDFALNPPIKQQGRYSRSRSASRSSYDLQNHPRKAEGAGKAGCRSHPWSACNKKARGRTTGTSRTSGLPCATVLTLIRALPRDRLSCPCVATTRVRALRWAPAPGRQDHTISRPRRCRSSAQKRLNTIRVHRIPHSTYRDDAYAPFDEAGCPEICSRFARRDKRCRVRHNGTTGNCRMPCMRKLPAGQMRVLASLLPDIARRRRRRSDPASSCASGLRRFARNDGDAHRLRP